MANQSLAERVAKKKSEEIQKERPTVENIVEKFRVSGRKIKYQTVRDDRWDILCDVHEFLNSSISDILREEDILLSDEQRSNLREFETVLNSCWNEEFELFDVEYETDSDGDLKSLIIPLESSISEDITIQNIHDDEGKFVATGVESQVDFEIYELWSMNIYADSLDSSSDVYTVSEETKSRLELFSDSIRQQSKSIDSGSYLNQSSAGEWLVKTLMSSVATFGFLFVTYTMVQSMGLTVLPFIFSASIFGLIPLMLCFITFVEFLTGALALLDSIGNKEKFNKTKLFRTTSR